MERKSKSRYTGSAILTGIGYKSNGTAPRVDDERRADRRGQRRANLDGHALPHVARRRPDRGSRGHAVQRRVILAAVKNRHQTASGQARGPVRSILPIALRDWLAVKVPHPLSILFRQLAERDGYFRSVAPLENNLLID